MRNIFVLLLRYHAVLLFIALEVISLSLVFNQNSYQRSVLLNSSQEVVGFTKNGIFEVSKFARLGQVNDSLAKVISQLKEQNLLNTSDQSPQTRIEQVNNHYYKFIPAKIISNSIDLRNNYLTLDLGSFEGIKKNMAVVSSNGVIGIIKGVSDHFSSGISLLHSDFAVGARIMGLNEHGMAKWSGQDARKATLYDIPAHVKLEKGQKVEVNSFSFIFPEGTYIGEVTDFKLNSSKAFYEVELLLADDFRNIQHVFVVENLFTVEKETLENEIKD